MGIPSYFSYIAKNHTNIIQKLCKFEKNIDNLYLDSNSIIYDCLRSISEEYKKCKNDIEFETMLNLAVCKKIDEYIINNFANAFTVAPVVTTSSTIASVLFVTPEYCVDKFPDVALGVTLEE